MKVCSPSWLKWLLPIHNESEKMTLHIQLHLHDSPDFTGVVWVPSQCRVDPQKLENTVEKPVGRGKCGLVGGRRGGEEAGWNPLFPPSLCLQRVMERWLHSPLLKPSVPGAIKLCCCWGLSAMHGLVFWVFFGFFSCFFI